MKLTAVHESVLTEREWYSIAVHESAHAVVALTLAVPVLEIVIGEASTQDCLGHMRTAVPCGEIPIDKYVTFVLAGEAAERHIHPAASLDVVHHHSKEDQSIARKLLAIMLTELKLEPLLIQRPSDETVARELQRLEVRAAQLVNLHWLWIRRVADVLLRARRLSGAEIERLR